MGDEERTKFISSNIVKLAESTFIGPELVASLFGNALITGTEKHLLMVSSTPNFTKALTLYTEIASKWNASQFEYFKQALQETGNLLALQVFTNIGGGGFLTIEQNQLLKQLRDKSEEGAYEGLSLEDEVNANRLVQITKGDGRFSVDGKFVLSAGLNMREVIHLVSHFEETLKNNVIWWNPRKPPVPKNYIERRVAETQDFKDDEDDINNTTTLIELGAGPSEDLLVLLVDAPGMGKSSEMSDLENKLREKVPTNRVILRVNLNEVQRTLATLSPSESASSVLLKLAPFIPANILFTVGVRVFVLLDGLDEVCPKHKDTMIDLLRIFTSANEPTFGRNLRVVVTTRPHLREVVQKEFKLESWSLLPLTKVEQDEYMKSVLGVSDEQWSEFRNNLADSVTDLLSNPLMLFMCVDVINSEGTFSKEGDELNIFELYTKYVESKHKLQLVEKEGMRAEDNFTEMRLEGMLEKTLPHYYRAAIRELIDEDEDTEDSDSEDEGNEDFPQSLIFRECEGGGLVAQDEPSGVTRDELLSIGLLVEGSHNQLVFKHRSFGEFFYARLLTQEDSAPEVVRDTLFLCIYTRNRLANVESFVVGASPASLSLSPKWLLLCTNLIDPTDIISEFAGGSEPFALLVREVLLSFVQGDPNDLWEAHRVLFDDRCRIAFRKLFDWMRENREWTREELLKISQITTSTAPPTVPPVGVANEVPQATARLMVAIGLHSEGQELLSEEEVGVAVNSCDHRILYVVAQFQKHGTGRSKWEWVESFLSGGRSQLKNLFMEMDNADWSFVIEDRESACKLVSTLSHEEISALVSSIETRVSDVIGEKPLEVGLALGEEFVPRGKQLAEFRGKFRAAKGKTVFEMKGGWQFALEYLWDDLVGEVGREDANGPVGVALREAFGRMGRNSWWLLRNLEDEIRRSVEVCRWHQKRKHSGEKEEENGAEDLGVKVMDWVTRGLRWSHSLTLDDLEGLPFVLRYYPNIHLSNLPQQNKLGILRNSDGLLAVLRSLVILSSIRSHDNEDSSLFAIFTTFLREQRHQIRSEWTPLFDLFLGATREQIRATSPRPLNLVSDLSVGRVALNIFTIQKPPTTATKMDMNTWGIIMRDLINLTPCCDVPATLQQICRLKDEDHKLEMLLKEALTSEDVLWGWEKRFSSKYRWEHVNLCAVRNLLSFYFSIFGLNCDWMILRDGVEAKADKWTLMWRLPVEIFNALHGNPHWTHLLPQFQQMLRDHHREKNFNSVRIVMEEFSYETEGEWDTLLTLINGETLFLGTPSTYPLNSFADIVAAPLFRVLLKLYGVEWTKSKVTEEVWNAIPSNVKYKNQYGHEILLTASSFGSLGSLLHSAVQLGELEEVKRRAWPGVVSWKNGEGKTALQLATEEFDEGHPIRLHLEHLSLQ